MINEKSKEFIHSWYIVLMTFFTLVFLLANKKLMMDLPLIFFMMYVFHKNGLTFYKIKRILFFAFIFSFSFFIISILYPAEALKTGVNYHFYYFEIPVVVFWKALSTMIRLFFVSFLSMSSTIAIDYSKVILYLISEKGLNVFWGYPLLLALNSISLFKKEFERIRINARLRNLPNKDKFSLLFPMLIFAIRHSQRGAMSLVTRGLNNHRNFYFNYSLSPIDKRWGIVFLTIYLFTMGISLMLHGALVYIYSATTL